MKSNNRLFRMTLALGVLTAIALVLSILALDDIASGGEGLAMEWNVLRVTALLIVMFLALSMTTLRRLQKQVTRELKNTRTAPPTP